MTINDLKEQSEVITNINVSEPIINPNLINNVTQQEVSPEELGFQKVEPSIPDEYNDINNVLAMTDKVIDKKIEEVITAASIIEQSENDITEKELREALGQDYMNEIEDEFIEEKKKEASIKGLKYVPEGYYENQKVSEDPIEEEDELYPLDEEDDFDEDDVEADDAEDIFNERTPYVMNDINTPMNFNAINNIEDTESKVVNIAKPVESVEDSFTPNITENIAELAFPEDEFGDDAGEDDINIDNKSEEELTEEEQTKRLTEAVKGKIKPVAKIYDLKSFTISNKPVALSSTLQNIESAQVRYTNWALYSSGRPIRMRGFSGTEIETLGNSTGSTRYQSEKNRYNLIFDHIMDTNKPKTMEEWAKCTSFLDLDHVWFAVYRSCFDGANYMPYFCENKSCNNIWLSDNLNIMDLVKFKNDKAKDKFDNIINSDITYMSNMYTTELVQISDTFAFSFKEPSIYNMIFENTLLDNKFTTKYQNLLSIIVYIDSIYQIDTNSMQLRPVQYKVTPNDEVKTLKAKIIQYSKVLKTLSSDQYLSIVSYISKLSENSDDITYIVPKSTCDNCKSVVEDTPMEARNMVFTRHQLATLAAM